MKSIGIDISKDKCDACVIGHDGKVLEETAYANTTNDAAKFARKMKRKYKTCQAACETTGNLWLKTFEAFESADIPIKLANTFRLKIISSADTKTDKIDARKIAQVLRAGMIPECYVAPPKVRGERELIRYIIALVQARTKMLNYLRNLLSKYDIKINAYSLYSKKALKQLDGVTLENMNDSFILANCVRRIRASNDDIAAVEAEIRKRAVMNEDVMRVMSMTGIDSFGAMLIVSEIADIKRFSTPESLVAWAGLCPTVYQSGDKEYHGHMRQKCNRRVRWMMIEAAGTAARHDPRMAKFYEKTLARHGGKYSPTIPHVANKMMRIIWKILTAHEKYESCNEDLYRRKLARLGTKN